MNKALNILHGLDNQDIWVLQQLRIEHTQVSEAIAQLEAKDKAIENAIATIKSLGGEMSKHSIVKILRDLKDNA